MTADPKKVRCRNSECRLAETGKCVEGLNFDECPHVAPDQGGAGSSPNSSSQSIEETVEGIGLPSGDRLGVAKATHVLRSGVSRVLAIVGPSDAGKTSLISAVYDLFQCGPVDQWQFARSQTLVAFERACHYARAASRRAVPHTERTSIGTRLGFYHLDLCRGIRKERLTLMMSDRAGEDYRSAADDPSVASVFVEVQRADSITLLVDGNRLRELGSRHNVKSEIEMMLQALVDGDATSRNQRVLVVLTKLDLVRGDPPAQRARTETYFGSVVENLREIFGSHFAEVTAVKIAASPANETLRRGYGVAELIGFWSKPVIPAPPVPSESEAPVRAMDRLTVAEQ